jgi:hypothetical protein
MNIGLGCGTHHCCNENRILLITEMRIEYFSFQTHQNAVDQKQLASNSLGELTILQS